MRDLYWEESLGQRPIEKSRYAQEKGFSFKNFALHQKCRGADADSDTLKGFFRSLFPQPAVVDGLGFDISKKASPNPLHDDVKASLLEHESQYGLTWKARLERGALISKLSSNLPANSNTNTDYINHLEASAKPGDIIFVTGGGKKQGTIAELADLVTRLVCSTQKGDHSFPFTHVMINIGDGTIIDLGPDGIRRQTWKQAFLDNEYYDCVALGRLQYNEKERAQFVEKVIANSKRLTRYNFAWVLLKAPFEVRMAPEKHVDSSVNGDAGVCTDLVTESARVLSVANPRFDLLSKSINPIRMFKSDALKIVGAVNLVRE